jgi:hypothetical protein
MPHLTRWALLLAVVVPAACAPANQAGDGTSPPPDLRADIQALYGSVGQDAHYFQGAADLNGDGAAEIFVHVAGPTLCGTGGCDTLVFTPTESGYDLLAQIGPARPPIQVSPRATNGWRNLLVRVGGGGLEAAYDAELLFDGTRYPLNPTEPPAAPATDTEGAETVIAPFVEFAEGTPLAAP